MADAHKNFAYSLVATAPVPATTGTSLVVTAGQGALFPTPPFNVTVWPAGAQPTSTTAEIVRVTAVAADTFTIVRQQEGSTVRSIVAGDQVANTPTAKVFTDIEASLGSQITFSHAQSNTAEVTNTLVETEIYGVDIPANTLLTGRLLVTRFLGDYLKNSAGVTSTWRLKLGATTLITYTPVEADSATRRLKYLMLELYAYGNALQIGHAEWYATEGTILAFGTATQHSVASPTTFASLSTLDMTVLQRLSVTIQYSAANLNLSIFPRGTKTLVFS
jgi:hypothetical protein